MSWVEFMLGFFLGSVSVAWALFARYRTQVQLVWSILEDEIIAPMMKYDAVRAKRLAQLIRVALDRFYK